MTTDDLEFWLGVYGGAATLAAVPFTWWITERTKRRATEDADRAALRDQADRLIVAVSDLRGAAITNQLLWESPRERFSTFVLALAAFAGGAARTNGPDLRRALAGAGDFARLLVIERSESKAAAARLSPLLTQVAACAAPLVRHPDPDVTATAEELLAAVQHVDDEARLDAALAAFGRAAREATTPPPTLWARIRSRRARIAA
ncbi:hypothetical protein [Streptomyces sp. NPDC059460]|uniref:hypothetical protein n=1 Tax=Streptomyces sp. NPDC059460 TaxID=3346840 RepID=UPI00368ADCF7